MCLAQERNNAHERGGITLRTGSLIKREVVTGFFSQNHFVFTQIARHQPGRQCREKYHQRGG